jgi:hypothetical protein
MFLSRSLLASDPRLAAALARIRKQKRERESSPPFSRPSERNSGGSKLWAGDDIVAAIPPYMSIPPPNRAESTRY